MSCPMRRRLPVAIVFILTVGSPATELRAQQAPGEVIGFTPERRQDSMILFPRRVW